MKLCLINLLAGFLVLSGVGCRGPVRDGAGGQPSVAVVPAGGSATVTDVRFHSEALGRLLWYRAIVPTVAPGERLPVLYLLQGGGSNPADMQERSRALKLAVAERLIVVTPAAGDSWYTNAKHRANARWEDAMVHDLTRDVDSRLPVLPGREHRGVAGLSMGGYGAVKLALKHPEMYGFAGSLSGAFDITRRGPNLLNPGQSWAQWEVFGFRSATEQEEDVFALLDRAVSPQSVKWFASCGSEDYFNEDNTKLVLRLGGRGAVVDAVVTPGKHNWQTWDLVFPQMFAAAGRSLR